MKYQYIVVLFDLNRSYLCLLKLSGSFHDYGYFFLIIGIFPSNVYSVCLFQILFSYDDFSKLFVLIYLLD